MGRSSTGRHTDDGRRVALPRRAVILVVVVGTAALLSACIPSLKGPPVNPSPPTVPPTTAPPTTAPPTEVGADPLAVDDTATVAEDATGTVVDVLANDTDADPGEILTVTAVDTTATLGDVTHDATDVTYTPNGAFDDLGQGDTATDTFDYTITDTTGRTATATATITITGGQMTVQIGYELFAVEPPEVGILPCCSPFHTFIDGSQGYTFDAVLDNAPTSGVSYRWRLDVPGQLDYVFAPVQTRPTVFMRDSSVPDFGQSTMQLSLEVTPVNGSPAVSATSSRLRYVNSSLTVAHSTTLQSLFPDSVPYADPDPVSVNQELIIHHADGMPTFPPPFDSLVVDGTVTHTDGDTILGTSPYGHFRIPAGTLSPGTHTITATYELYVDGWGAHRAFSRDVTVTVTP